MIAALHAHNTSEILTVVIVLVVIGFLAGALYVGVALRNFVGAAILAVIGVVLAVLLL